MSRDFTKDIDRIQKQVDFRIIVPSHLPNNLFNPPNALSPAQLWRPPSVLLLYGVGKYETEGLIEIYEWGYPVGPTDQLGNETILVSGIEVVQKEHTESYLTSDGPVDHPGYVFYWSQNEVYFEAGIYHYDYEEAVKVVESMIQQE